MKGRGGVNMKGKKTRRLACKCCMAFDGRVKPRARFFAEAIEDALRTSTCPHLELDAPLVKAPAVARR